MKSTVLMGGLGNQLFQIFHLIAYCLRYNYNFRFRYSEILEIGNPYRPTYWNSFLKNLKQFTLTGEYGNQILNLPKLYELAFHFIDYPNIKQPFIFEGYFQSYKYFEKEYNTIINIIKLKKQQEKIIKKYSKYINNKNNLISMHFRYSDYKNIQEHHPIMKIDYYKKSLKIIINKINIEKIDILYFNEKIDNMEISGIIKLLEKEFPNLSFNKAPDDAEDWEQMLMMSLCQHNIIANSSFSWWGAYFNDNNNKIITYPSKWFGPAQGNKKMDDMYPKKWIKIII
jgi:hypothetical protein